MRLIKCEPIEELSIEQLEDQQIVAFKLLCCTNNSRDNSKLELTTSFHLDNEMIDNPQFLINPRITANASNNSPFPNPNQNRRSNLRPPSNTSSRLGSQSNQIRNNGNRILQSINNNMTRIQNLRSIDHQPRDPFANINMRPYENLIRNNNLEDHLDLDLLDFNANRRFMLDSDSDEEVKEQRFEFNLQHEIEELLMPDVRFRDNQNTNFRSTNRSNALRQMSNQNRIQQQRQQNEIQNPLRAANRVSPNRNQNLAIPINENINVGFRLNRMRGGLQNLRRRLEDLDQILDDIEEYQVETDQLVQNIEQIDRLLGRQNQEQKKGISDEGLKKQKCFTYSQIDGQDTCSICIKNVSKDEKVYELVCKHIFHEECIDPWLKQSHLCPNCRKDLN
ncbi:zinc finger protein [Stylonychia lemnae]|uniref:Zinc finger protein n=1 Tax=Stylonychia lemnae TaxID=5949 RepID=A0A077ZWG3_STYLE|nr:zinc finger protein [Stylonychia lemnae]|eukprot:CDW74285.1 zinc finger protein [Stylonychia lemnae]